MVLEALRARQRDHAEQFRSVFQLVVLSGLVPLIARSAMVSTNRLAALRLPCLQRTIRGKSQTAGHTAVLKRLRGRQGRQTLGAGRGAARRKATAWG